MAQPYNINGYNSDGELSSSPSIYSSHSGSYTDSLEELLSRFTLDFRPEYTLKFRNRLGPVIVGVDTSHIPDLRTSSGALVIKPVNASQWWRRLRIDTSGDVTLRSRKLNLGFITLHLEGVANPVRRTTSASFRVATRWSATPHEASSKRRVVLGEATEGRVHWNVNYNLPEFAGSFSGGRGAQEGRDLHTELGYAHGAVSRVELVMWPWRNNPRAAISALPEAVEVEKEGPSVAEMTEAPAADSTQGVGVEGERSAEPGDWLDAELVGLQRHIKELRRWRSDWRERSRPEASSLL